MSQEKINLTKNVSFLQKKFMKNNAPDIFFETPYLNKIPERKIENLLTNNSKDTRGLISNLLPQTQNKVIMYNPFTFEDDCTSNESEATEEVELIDNPNDSIEISYRCPKYGCSAVFSNVKDFNSHYISSHLEKKYKCKEKDCNKMYTRIENLKQHISVKHLKKLQYKCRFCNKEFTNRNGVNYHEKKIHINNTPYKCIYPGTFKII
jgi:hypothetical protein